MTVAELSDRMSAAELLDWLALQQRQPWGRARDDARAAIIGHQLYIVLCKGLLSKSGQRKALEAKTQDFIPITWDRAAVHEDPKAKAQRMYENAKAWTAHLISKGVGRRGD